VSASPFADRFVIGERVGRGAFGEVLRGVDRENGGPVAIKRLRETDPDPATLERFDREARMLQRIEHPNVVGFVAQGIDATGRPCVALEWLEGSDLGSAMRREAFSIAAAVDVGRQVARGLQALHDEGIVHRDVKPSNVFLADQRNGGRVVKLMDLGVARATFEHAMTVDGYVIGTPAYMSPEQARGDTEITPMADVFSLGAMLYELLTGKRPFSAADVFAVLAKIVLETPREVRAIAPDVPEALAAIVRRAMTKVPAARWPSAAALANALDGVTSVRNGVPTPSSPVAPIAVEDERDDPTWADISGERRAVTLVFVRMRSRAAATALLPTFDALVTSQGGEAYHLRDRALVAVFGTQQASGDEALRGAHVALAVRAADGTARIALATSLLASGSVGPPGPAIERAAAAIGRADEGIVADEVTARLLVGRFVLESREGSVLLARPLALDDDPPPVAGRVTSTTGRDEQLLQLRSLFDECVERSDRRSVAIDGDAGIGKSRLRHEFIRTLRRLPEDARPIVWLSRGDPLATRSPLGLIAQLLRAAVGIRAGELPRAQRARLLEHLSVRLKPDPAQRSAAFLADVLGIGVDGSTDAAVAAARGSPALAGDYVRGAFEALLRAHATNRPVVIVLEDLQWADPPSLGCIDASLASVRGVPWVLVMLGRTEIVPTLESRFAGRGVGRMHLAELRPDACAAIAAQVLGSHVDTARVRSVVDRAGGNAFYLEELLRSVIDGRAGVLPETILGIAQSRLDALSPAARVLTRSASVFGRAFWRTGLRNLALSMQEAPFDAALGEMLRAEIVVARSASQIDGQSEHAFLQSMVRDAAYESLHPGDRERLHGAVAAWLERVGAPDDGVLAEHFERAGHADRAVPIYLRVARRTLEGGDPTGAIAYADRAVAAGAVGAALGQARVICAEALTSVGNPPLIAERAREAMQLLPRGSIEWFQAAGLHARSLGQLGSLDAFEAVAEDILAAPHAPGAAATFAGAVTRVCSHLIMVGRCDRGSAYHDEAERFITDQDRANPHVRGALHSTRARVMRYRGDLQGFLDEWRAAADAFERAGDLRSSAIPWVNAAFALLEIGENEEAIAVLRRADDLGERLRMGNVRSAALNNLGLALARAGRHSEGLEVERRALAFCLALGDRRLAASSRSYIAAILEMTGDLQAALAAATAGAESAGEFAPIRAGALATLAKIQLALGRPDEALATASDAAELRAHIDVVVDDDAGLTLVLAKALAAAGRFDEAKTMIHAGRARLLARADTLHDSRLRERFLSVTDHAETLRVAEAW